MTTSEPSTDNVPNRKREARDLERQRLAKTLQRLHGAASDAMQARLASPHDTQPTEFSQTLNALSHG
jgi:hypothetical protein